MTDLSGYEKKSTAGTSGERKRAIEALVHEVRITEHGMIPVFKIPEQRRHPCQARQRRQHRHDHHSHQRFE